MIGGSEPKIVIHLHTHFLASFFCKYQTDNLLFPQIMFHQLLNCYMLLHPLREKEKNNTFRRIKTKKAHWFLLKTRLYIYSTYCEVNLVFE